MKWNNLFAGAILIILTVLLTNCHKDDDSPYKSYPGELGRHGYCSVVNSESDVYIVGSRDSEILILKTSLNGDLIWEKTYNLFGPDVHNDGWTIEETFDHGFLISANSLHPWQTYYYNGLLKINAAGDSLWSIILQDSGHVALKAVIEAADHNIIVVHEDEKAINEDLPLITISKISPDGMLIESKPYPELQMPEVSINGWQASQDGSVMISVSRYNQAASIWTINTGLDVTSQESFQDGKESAYFTESPGEFICTDEVYEQSTHLYINKTRPGNDPDWTQDIPMPCTKWVWSHCIRSVTGGYIVLGTLWDDKKSYAYVYHSYCMGLDAEGNQTWLWYDDVDIFGTATNFHSISENEYLIVGIRDVWDEYEDYIVLWRLKNGNVIN